ncbi:ATP synthase F1 subunit delta [Candidatus Poribacteria bacterium]|nr:MAG: ATP synthase F1 subunit delta [Candidatus Poribacteria bacterium]
MRDIRVAKPYARALYDAAVEQNALPAVVADVRGLTETMEQSEEFAQFLSSPLLSPQMKGETFQNLFAESVHPLTLNFLRLLALKQRERYLLAIGEVLLAIVDEAAGRLVAKVTTAVSMTAAQQAELAQQLRAYSGKEVRLETTVDAAVQGGFIVQLDDTVFDASVATQLRRLKQQLAKG